MHEPTVIAVIAAILLPLDWIAAIWLIVLARKNKIPALRERALAACVLAVASTVIVGIIINARLDFSLFSRESVAVVSALVAILMSMPALYWIWLYRDAR